MKAQTTPAGVLVTLEPVEALQLLEDLEKFDVEAHSGMATAHLYRAIREACSARVSAPPEPPQLDHTEPEPSGRDAELEGQLPRYIDILAAHILPANREYTVRIYQCDSSDRRHANETLARTFPKEEAARKFYGQTQNVWNMRVRAGDAPAYDVVLGVQDKRKHAKKASYRDWEHVLCKGGPA